MSRLTLHFIADGWDDYMYWQVQDKKMLQKINRLLEEIVRNPFIGTGKPEPLKSKLAGVWSRRINREHRLVYVVTRTEIKIISCRFHYPKNLEISGHE